MKRFITLGFAILATMAFVAAAAGAPPSTKGPYTLTTPDGGCAGNQWANDNVSRTYEVKKAQDVNGAPAWRVTRIDRGTFTTLAGPSPGNCAQNTAAHGTTVTAGVTGKVHGRLVGVVTGGTYNPNATCGNECGPTATFISTFFGSGAQYSCTSGVGSCDFVFNYHATQQGLAYKHWTDEGDETHETFTGDIATRLTSDRAC